MLFGTDSLDYVATWLGSVHAGAIPVVVSDLYKQKDLLYFLVDTAVRVLYIDSEQLPKLIEIAAGTSFDAEDYSGARRILARHQAALPPPVR